MLLNLVYLLALLVLSPWLIWRTVSTGRYRRELAAKLFGRVTVPNPSQKPVAWFHAVSVGEVNLSARLFPRSASGIRTGSSSSLPPPTPAWPKHESDSRISR